MRVDFITLGCSKNLVDSEHLIKQLELNNYSVYHDDPNPIGPIVIINTCGFIGDAKEESINTILSFVKQKKQKKIKQLYVMGCLSERYKKELQEEIPEVDAFYGKFDYHKLVSDLGKKYFLKHRLERTITTPKHYAYIKIAEGCNQSCAYCAIPIITGKYTSRPIDEIEEEVRMLVSQGVKEFQLIAQDLTSYGLDIYKKQNLAYLMERLSEIDGVEWLRLHYGYPQNFPYDILPLIREKKNVCLYLDIAFQHISDSVLKRMHRRITKKEIYDLIEKICKEVPNICLRTTLMVGFPGETEQDFEELKDFVKTVRFKRMGAFIYSEEDGTFAAKKYKDDISQEVKQQRLDELMELQYEISKELNQQRIGEVVRVIIDRQDAEYYIGRTEYDSPEVDPEVLIKKENNQLEIGLFYNVQIIDFDEYDVYAELV